MSSPTEKAILTAHETLSKSVKQNKSKPYAFRISQLQALKRFFHDHMEVLKTALKADLGRGPFEAHAVEIASVTGEIELMIKNLKSWMEPKYTPVSPLFAPASSEIHHDPYGLCLIIGAFNYPVLLTISPLLGAIAAGNCAIIKPSELATQTEEVFSKLLHKYLDPDCYRVVTGSIAETTLLLSLRWDKIFFTGSTRVGKIIAKAAAEHLTPISLELGGKSPTIVDKDITSFDVAISRVLWGKGINAGQTCVAPDYIYVHEKVYDRFLEALKDKIKQFYGENPQASPDFGRIVNKVHFQRLKGLLEDSRDKIYSGGRIDESERFIEPTIFTNLSKSAKIMQEEIFGPLLPVFKYSRIEEVIEYVNSGEKPLTMMIFSNNRTLVDRLIDEVPSGSVIVNDSLMQFANLHTSVGGVGYSGMGNYRGYYSYECFSHRRQVLRRNDWKLLDIPIRYPPYTTTGYNIFLMAAKLPDVPPITFRGIIQGLFFLGVLGVGIIAALKVADKI